MKRILVPILAALSAYALAQPVTIGLLSPLTGGAAGTGQAQRAGFELALEEINAAGGVLGEPLEVVLEDTQADAEVALAAFEKLMTEDGVSFIAGGYSSGATLALVESLRTFQPIVSWIGGAVSGVGIEDFDGIEELLGEEPWFFHVHPWDYHNVEAATDFVVDSGVSSVALLYEDSAFGGPGSENAQGLLDEAGLEVPLREAFTSTLFGGSGDYRAAINKAAATDAEMLYWIGYDSDVVPLISQVRELGYTPEQIFGAPPGWPAEFAGASEAECVTGLIGFLPNLPTPEATAFTEAYRDLHGSDPDNYMSALAYASLWSFADAINAAGTTEYQAVIDQMASMTFDSPMGEWSFGPSAITDRQGFDADMWLVFQYQDGVRELVWPLDQATAPLQSCR
ncbi:MAG: ABC transporter substrate-binding protein [Trueperaceae bacterium]|nr:ABC transporter substrate-binding protein [Trueperaceae bacterium]